MTQPSSEPVSSPVPVPTSFASISPDAPSTGDLVPASYRELAWQDRLSHVVETMRTVSALTDPQEMVRAYAQRMRGTIAPGHTVSLSRRGLEQPSFRITRTSLWKDQPDPWREQHRLPLLQGGLLADMLYSDRPFLINDFHADPGDPAYAYLQHARSLAAIPHFENGQGLNMVVHTGFEKGAFDAERFPDLVQMSNLFGRATKNLVLSRDLRLAYEALDAELRSVQDIQLSLLPREMPDIPGLDVATHYQTSTRAGGDYYDFFELAGGKWGILVADVSGHGTPAAVLMAIVHAIAHLMPGDPWPPDRAMEFVNRALTSRYTRGSGAFVTMIYGIYDPVAGTFTYANAGHPEPLVRSPGGGVSALSHPGAGLPLGILDDARYETHTVTFEPSSSMAIYTDGITEAFGSGQDAGNAGARGREMFGEQRLRDALSRAGPGASDAVGVILDDLGRFAGLESRSDDRTLVVLSRCPVR